MTAAASARGWRRSAGCPSGWRRDAGRVRAPRRDPPRRAEDERRLDCTAEKQCEPVRGPVEESVVGLVEVELVLERASHPGEARAQPRRCVARVTPEPPGEQDADKRDAHREHRRDHLHPPVRLHQRRGDRLEERLHRRPAAGHLGPAADNRENHEHGDRPHHRQRPFEALFVEVVLDVLGRLPRKTTKSKRKE